MSKAKILIVEDEGIEALDIQHRLKSLGYDAPDIVFSGEDAVLKAEEASPNLVLMDIMLNGEIDGVTAAEEIHTRFDIPIIYLTAYADEDTLKRAKITEPYGYIVKPFRDREVHITIDMALYRHQMERKLRESQKWFATTLRSIGDAVIATDKKGLITFMNAVAENLTGWRQEDVSNKRLGEVLNIISRETRQPVEDPVERLMLREGPDVGLENRIKLVARNGIEIPIDLNASPIKDDKGNFIGVILVFRDITEREKAEEELRRANAELEERVALRTADLALTNKHLKQEIEQRKRAEKWLQEKNIELENAKLSKERFLVSLSHQLRTALDTTIGFTNALLSLQGSVENQERQLQMIRRTAQSMPSLINDLLDLAKIEAGTVEIKTEAVDLGNVIREVMGAVKPMAEQKGLKFIDEIPEVPVVVRTDRRALSQILLNLTNNAINFTEMGKVHLEFAQRQSGGEFMTEISVVGTGSSVGEEYQKKLSEAFRQLDSTSLRPPAGTGLGLYLSQRLAQMIGGVISLNSVYGKGSVFTLTLK